MGKIVAIGYNTCRYAYRFRGGLIKQLVAEGNEVYVLAPEDAYSRDIELLGARVIDVPITNSVSPFANLNVFLRFCATFRRLGPDVYLGFTIKPNTLGGVAAFINGIPYIASIAGLGRSFSDNTFVMKIAELLYRISLRPAKYVLMQNDEDRAEFVLKGLVRQEQVIRIPGSGVDVDFYQLRPKMPDPSGEFYFLFLSRLLWSKGVREYVEASGIIKSKFPRVRCLVMGHLEEEGPKDSLCRRDLEELSRDGVVEVLNGVDDVRDVIAKSDCVVLPSYYREGVPRVLLESAAMGRPIITTDSVGCREAVVPDITGVLVPPRDHLALAAAMEGMVLRTQVERDAMGRAGRAYVEEKYREQHVIDTYVRCIEQCAK